jgi:hemolysin D
MVEIEEALPSPVGRTMAWTIITVFTVTVLWAVFSTVDIIASPVLQAGQESVRER